VRSGAFWTIPLHFYAVLCRKVIEIQFDVTENKTDCELGIEVAVEGSNTGVINLTCGARGGAFG
jgi:thiamine pyrophosphokinase